MCCVITAVDMTFTTMNVLKVVQEVELEDTDRLGYYLRVPESKRQEIHQLASVPQQRKALINYYINNNPVASWRAVIAALDGMEAKRVANELRHLAEPVTGRAGIARGCMQEGGSAMIYVYMHTAKL